MVHPDDIRQKAQRQYSKYLRARLQGLDFFPLELPFNKKLPQSFAQLKAAIDLLDKQSKRQQKYSYTVRYEVRQTRQLGAQSLPVRIAFESASDFLGYLRKQQEAQQIEAIFQALTAAFPELQDWALQRPKRLLPYAKMLDAVLKVLRYFKAHPRPNCYIRELPIEVDTKFIEQQAKYLRPLLDEILPETAVDANSSKFAQRYGLKRDAPRIRFRQLDPTLDPDLFRYSDDLSMPLPHFKLLRPEATTVFICENRLPFLTLPNLSNTLGIFGQGFAVGQLAEAEWLKKKRILYWGDLDAHGFGILAQLRQHFPQVESCFMDVETLAAFAEYQVEGKDYALDEALLKPKELAAYQQLKASGKRLEQERLPQPYVEKQLRQLIT